MLTKKKKLVAAAFSAVLLLSAAIGGGTYAYFTSTAQNTGNTFKAGTLSLSTHRNDVPIEGPMFYTNDSAGGQMGTGFWAPRDSNTRALLIRNTGSLDAKLTHLTAVPEGSAGQQADALAFGDQALVTIAALKPSGDIILSAEAIETVNRAIDKTFKSLTSIGWHNTAQGVQEAAALVREALLNQLYVVNSDGQSVNVRVTDLYVGKLKNLYNGGSGQDAILPNLVLAKGKVLHLGYTVTFLDDEGQTLFNNNELQGKQVNFTFSNQFEQLKNNN